MCICKFFRMERFNRSYIGNYFDEAIDLGIGFVQLDIHFQAIFCVTYLANLLKKLF